MKTWQAFQFGKRDLSTVTGFVAAAFRRAQLFRKRRLAPYDPSSNIHAEGEIVTPTFAAASREKLWVPLDKNEGVVKQHFA